MLIQVTAAVLVSERGHIAPTPLPVPATLLQMYLYRSRTHNELRHDGFRAIAYIKDGDCRLESRNLKPLIFKSLRASLASISLAKNAILDGEIIVLDATARTQETTSC